MMNENYITVKTLAFKTLFVETISTMYLAIKHANSLMEHAHYFIKNSILNSISL